MLFQFILIAFLAVAVFSQKNTINAANFHDLDTDTLEKIARHSIHTHTPSLIPINDNNASIDPFLDFSSFENLARVSKSTHSASSLVLRSRFLQVFSQYPIYRHLLPEFTNQNNTIQWRGIYNCLVNQPYKNTELIEMWLDHGTENIQPIVLPNGTRTFAFISQLNIRKIDNIKKIQLETLHRQVSEVVDLKTFATIRARLRSLNPRLGSLTNRRISMMLDNYLELYADVDRQIHHFIAQLMADASLGAIERYWNNVRDYPTLPKRKPYNDAARAFAGLLHALIFRRDQGMAIEFEESFLASNVIFKNNAFISLDDQPIVNFHEPVFRSLKTPTLLLQQLRFHPNYDNVDDDVLYHHKISVLDTETNVWKTVLEKETLIDDPEFFEHLTNLVPGLLLNSGLLSTDSAVDLYDGYFYAEFAEQGHWKRKWIRATHMSAFSNCIDQFIH